MLTWLTAWARLIVDDDVASQVANQAVARAASRRKRLRGADLKVAARHEAAGLLARGIAAAPKENGPASPGAYAAHAVTSATMSATAISQAYAPGAAGDTTAGDPNSDSDSGNPNSGNPMPRDPREQTTIGRLEMALETLAPYERLACVSYFLDGVSTDAIAALLGVPRDRAIRILEQAAPTVARAVGDNEIPDFSAATDEVEVVAR